MLKTCFGCCPLRNGVSTIAIVNMIWNILELLFHGENRYSGYKKYTTVYYITSNTTDDYIDTMIIHNGYYFSNANKISVLSDMFMDYTFMLHAGWAVLEIISNINLKQSTFKQAPHKIYVWLTVYYANLLFMIIHTTHTVLVIIKHSNETTSLDIKLMNNKHFANLYFNLLYIVIILFEIAIIHSYYIVEHNAMLNTFVQLKWKYISEGKVESQGVHLTSTSAFMSSTSRQTQEGSKLPPYITNVIQN